MSTREVRKARRDFQHMLQAYRQRRVQALGAKIEYLLETSMVEEAGDHLVR